MRLTILGSGTIALDTDRACSGYHLAAGELSLLFDCGSGTLKRCVEAGVDFFDLDLIALSHTRHPDHAADLPAFLFAINIRITRAGRLRRTRPMTLLGPPGTRHHYETLVSLHPAIAPADYALEIRECGDDEVRIGAVRLVTRRVSHGDVPAIGFRLEHGGAVFGYSGDTAPCAALAELFRDADLAVMECSFPADGPATGEHMNAREAGAAADDAGVRRLLLTHRYPLGDPARVVPQVRERYRGALAVAEDLAVHDVAPPRRSEKT